MKKLFFLCLLAISAAIQVAAQPGYRAKALALVHKMTLKEKIGQLNLVIPGGAAVTGSVVSQDVESKITKGEVGGLFGITSPEKVRKAQDIAVKHSRLHIPLLFGLDVIHGHKTIFPIPLGLAATWDTILVKNSARIAATEATADGLNWAFSPMVDIARDPRWGRIAEGSGEDPYLGSLMARAMVKGYQGEDPAGNSNNTLMACVKHFALYGAAEAGRDYNTVDMSRIKMYEYYLPPYKAAIDAGVGSVMSSFNEVDGVPATGNRWLLTDLLRRQWGFKGFVVSDYTSVNEMSAHGTGDLKTVAAKALNAGLDMDMVGEGFLTTLEQSLKDGKVTMQQIDEACTRIIEAKYKLGLFDDPYRYIDESRPARDILTDANRKAAREIATHSFVLLKNEGQLLPLRQKKTIALIGPLADNKKEMLGTWVVAGDPMKAVSVLEGVQRAAEPGTIVLHAKGANITDDPVLFKGLNPFGPQVEKDNRPPAIMLQEALATADKADVIVAVLGESVTMSGEASSRSDIGIPDSQEALLKALVNTGKPIVLVLFTGRPLTLTWEDAHVNTILNVWAPGTEAGNAIADVLFGRYNPSGRLTATFPRSVGQIPIYYNHKRTGRPFNDQSKFTSKYLDVSNEPLYPFGFGLSYTEFAYGDLQLNHVNLKGNQTLTATVTVKNTGKYAGEETVQLYISDPVASVTRSVKDLKGFQKIFLQPGEQKEVRFTITTGQLKFYNGELKYDWEPGDFIIQVGPSSATVQSASVQWSK
ncbi:MAG: beta-glucosidase BglX [Sediminibacterium sp.]